MKRLIFAIMVLIAGTSFAQGSKARIIFTVQIPDTTGFYLNGLHSKPPATGGRLTMYNWFKISGPGCMIAKPDSPRTLVRGLLTGTYLFRLQVVASNGKVANDTLKVIVK